jgi:hypothetical protein
MSNWPDLWHRRAICEGQQCGQLRLLICPIVWLSECLFMAELRQLTSGLVPCIPALNIPAQHAKPQ